MGAFVSTFQPAHYGPVFAEYLQIDRRRSLGGGTPDTAARVRLESLTIDNAFAHTSVANHGMAHCCLAGVWLLHDFLDESHTMSQGVSTSSGSFWHGIMHRREGDFSNAKYWFRKVGGHPVYQRLAAALSPGTDQSDVNRIVVGGEWDPFAFVDLCQQSVQGLGYSSDFCRVVQQIEWEVLFEHCYRKALAG